MRTFHTGGAFTADSSRQIRVKAGFIFLMRINQEKNSNKHGIHVTVRSRSKIKYY